MLSTIDKQITSLRRFRAARRTIDAVLGCWVAVCCWGCGPSSEAAAETACEAIRAVESESPRRALQMMRRLYHEMPTAGTAAAARCLRPLKERMGRVRTQITLDRAGDPETIVGCAWAADAVEIFSDVHNPPFRKTWARRLMERCAVVVGRAWTRVPDDPFLRALHEKLTRYSKE